ncbi:MAG: hypothetical protein GY828_01065 [Candidatus Gracilibacteria bacterium]|nr:hypothetical protein [Candidatus Gracilibacteria bacterium]
MKKILILFFTLILCFPIWNTAYANTTDYITLNTEVTDKLDTVLNNVFEKVSKKPIKDQLTFYRNFKKKLRIFEAKSKNKHKKSIIHYISQKTQEKYIIIYKEYVSTIQQKKKQRVNSKNISVEGLKPVYYKGEKLTFDIYVKNIPENFNINFSTDTPEGKRSIIEEVKDEYYLGFDEDTGDFTIEDMGKYRFTINLVEKTTGEEEFVGEFTFSIKPEIIEKPTEGIKFSSSFSKDDTYIEGDRIIIDTEIRNLPTDMYYVESILEEGNNIEIDEHDYEESTMRYNTTQAGNIILTYYLKHRYYADFKEVIKVIDIDVQRDSSLLYFDTISLEKLEDITKDIKIELSPIEKGLDLSISNQSDIYDMYLIGFLDGKSKHYHTNKIDFINGLFSESLDTEINTPEKDSEAKVLFYVLNKMTNEKTYLTTMIEYTVTDGNISNFRYSE